MSILKEGLPVGLACDHAGFEAMKIRKESKSEKVI